MARSNHPYIPNSSAEVKREMMSDIGVADISDLFSDIPEEYILKKQLNLPLRGASECEVKKHVESLLSRNHPCGSPPAFLGAGCWRHYVPAVVKEIVQRSEFLTSYTPYQPEISQGMLQALFEYQSMICELTGMEVANCSMYDWPSALGEAARMAARVKTRSEILIPKIVHPERAATLRAYAEPAGIGTKEVAYVAGTGQIDLEDLKRKISKETAAVYVENPSYLGFIDDQVDEISKEAHLNEALLIVGVDPTSLGVLKPPGDYGADIVVGEGQPLGNSMNFGGPMLGIMACRDDMSLIRQMPGRIIGLTTTQNNSRHGFCMALQTREQHIRREKATSNICTNEALCALASAVYVSLIGPKGLRELSETLMCKSHYAMRLLSKINHVAVPVFKSAHFKEFTVSFGETGMTVKEVNSALSARGIQAGKDISKEFPELGETALYCVTETHSKEDIDFLHRALEEIVSNR